MKGGSPRRAVALDRRISPPMATRDAAAIIELATITARKYPTLVSTSQLIRSHAIRIPGKFINGVVGSRLGAHA